MTRPEHIVVAGASLAGLRAAEALRAHRFAGRLTIVGAEPHAPYDRPPLCKQVALGMIDAAGTTLPRERDIAADWRLGTPATRLDRAARALVLADGERITYDRLLIATGARAAPWPNPSEASLRGVLTLRTREDAATLRTALAAKPGRVVVIGGGFNGCEIASACRALDIPVTLFERNATPLARALGCQVGRAAATLQRAHGVDLRCQSTVERLEGDAYGHVRRVHQAGNPIPVDADLVIVALGTIPNVEWLAGSGLAADRDGLACDDMGRVLDRFGEIAEDIFAAGDIARQPIPVFGLTSGRLEHWSNAIAQGRVAAANMIGARLRHDAVPTFWSSQFDVGIKAVGVPSAATEVAIVQGSLESGAFVAVYGRQGRIVAAVTFDEARWLQRYVPLVADAAPFPCPGGMNAPPSPDPMPALVPGRAPRPTAIPYAPRLPATPPPLTAHQEMPR